jgi:hypothetical protein
MVYILTHLVLNRDKTHYRTPEGNKTHKGSTLSLRTHYLSSSHLSPLSASQNELRNLWFAFPPSEEGQSISLQKNKSAIC